MDAMAAYDLIKILTDAQADTKRLNTAFRFYVDSSDGFLHDHMHVPEVAMGTVLDCLEAEEGQSTTEASDVASVVCSRLHPACFEN